VPDQLASSSFQMSRDALPFPNFVSGFDASELDTTAMQRMFGDQVCVTGSSPCQLTSAAQTFLEQANASMSGGRCEGFAVLSDLLAAKKLDVTTFGGATARDLSLEGNPALQKEIAYWFATQLVPAAVAEKTKKLTARDALPVIADSFEEGATEHYRIGIVRKQGANISGGHSLTPIGFYKDPSATGVYWLRVYDNNFPDVERLMKLDTVKNRWEFEASTEPGGLSRLYYGDSSNNNPLYLAPVFSRQGVLPCPFCEGGGAQVMTAGGTQATVETPAGVVGVSEGEISEAQGTSLTPNFSDANDAEATSFLIGLSNSTLTAMGSGVVVRVTAPADPWNPDAFQGVGVLRNASYAAVRGLRVTASDTFTATVQGGTYTNASRSPLELVARVQTPMGELTVSAFVTGGSDSARAAIDPATGEVTVQLTGSMGAPVGVLVQGRTTSGVTRTAQFTFTSSTGLTFQAQTTGWMQGGVLTGRLDNGGVTITVSNACSDGVKSGMESDVDCGTACNVGCAPGRACAVDADCDSQLCHPTRKVCITDACQDTRQSPLETGVDCGGPCAPCAVGGGCRATSDCVDPLLNDCVTGTCTRVYSVGAAVTFPPEFGSGAGMELVLGNGMDRLTVQASGSYTFPTRTTGAYAVSIIRQPFAAECTLLNGTGTATSSVFVQVSCVRRFTLGGLVTGLPFGESVTLSNNGSTVTVAQEGGFVFPLQPQGPYAVTVTTQPTSATCIVTNGTGAALTADVNDVTVTCTSAPTFTIGGTVSGLAGGQSVVLTNNGEQLTRGMNGAFVFPTPVTGAYAVTVTTQPVGQMCTVMNGTGTATANVSNVQVVCTATGMYTIGGTLTGLAAGRTLVLDNNGDQLSLMMNGSFTFATQVSGPYNVTITTQPLNQTCVVMGGAGTATANVTSVSVVCPGAPGRDMTFGTNGFLRVAHTSEADGWNAMVVNPDGTFVLAGFTGPTALTSEWIVSKVTQAGAIDTTFGVNGHRTISAAAGLEEAKALVRDAMGRYVVAGTLQGTTNLDLGVARLTSAGALDTSFGTNGIARFDFGADDLGTGVAIDSMGRIVVVGHQGQFGGEMVVARLTSAGALDTTFATNGRYLTATTETDALHAVVVDGSNNVVAVGYRDQDSAVLKLTPSGVPDMTFGTMGVFLVDLTTGLYADRLNAVALDGTRIVAAGAGQDAAASNFYLAAFTATGALDTTFGAGGIRGVGGATPDEAFTSLAPRPGGGWYAAGYKDDSAAVLRFSATGDLDLTFGTAGEFLDAYSGVADVFAVAVDSVGRVVIAGALATSGMPTDLCIARVNP
jgi:uncharacterized delta-60 repeat protein